MYVYVYMYIYIKVYIKNGYIYIYTYADYALVVSFLVMTLQTYYKVTPSYCCSAVSPGHRVETPL